jgi:hypothetical protein
MNLAGRMRAGLNGFGELGGFISRRNIGQLNNS